MRRTNKKCTRNFNDEYLTQGYHNNRRRWENNIKIDERGYGLDLSLLALVNKAMNLEGIYRPVE